MGLPLHSAWLLLGEPEVGSAGQRARPLSFWLKGFLGCLGNSQHISVPAPPVMPL